MNKVLCLVRTQAWAVIRDTLSIGHNKKKKSSGLYAGLAVFILLMSGVSFLYCFMIGYALKMFGSLELLPTLMMSVTSIVVLMTTMFKVKGTIFGFRDYDLVMSLPVSTGTIVASRIIIFYILNFIFVIMLMVPMIISYGILAKPSVSFYIYGLVSLFFVPLIPIVVASVIGTIIAYVASKFRHSNLLNIIFSLTLLILIMGMSFTMQGNGQELVNMSKVLTDKINTIYPLAGIYTAAITSGDFLAFLLFLVIQTMAFVLFVLIVRTIFKKLNTRIMTGRALANYKMGELKASSPFKALYRKEVKRYFASPLYVLNTGVGIVLLTLGAISLFFVDLEQVLGNAEGIESLLNSAPVYIIFCINMTCTTMASISLEGKSLWIVKSMPVDPKTLFLSKIAVNLTVIAPAMVDVILLGIAIKTEPVQIVIMLLITAVCAVFISIYGLLINLLLPNLNWSSEVVVVKQSAASLVTIFSGFAFIGLQVLLMVLLPSLTMAYLCYILIMVLVNIVIYRILMTYGRRRFYLL